MIEKQTKTKKQRKAKLFSKRRLLNFG